VPADEAPPAGERGTTSPRADPAPRRSEMSQSTAVEPPRAACRRRDARSCTRSVARPRGSARTGHRTWMTRVANPRPPLRRRVGRAARPRCMACCIRPHRGSARGVRGVRGKSAETRLRAGRRRMSRRLGSSTAARVTATRLSDAPATVIGRHARFARGTRPATARTTSRSAARRPAAAAACRAWLSRITNHLHLPQPPGRPGARMEDRPAPERAGAWRL
jgi:hypothetical protein